MKNRVGLSLALAFGVSSLVFAQGNVAGKWTGEMAGRGGNQPVTLELTVSGTTVTGKMTTGQGQPVDITNGKLEGGTLTFSAPGGGGGGGGRGMGMGGPQTYNLDGSEATSEVGGGQMTGKATSKATWAGNDLGLSRTMVFQGPNGEITSVTTQKLSLSGDGKVLTAVVHSESPRGTTDSTMVFNKQ